jgi:hypothetical protein
MKTHYFIIAAGITCALSSCDKPTSGQNTRDYRDGNSGAAPSTVEGETILDSTKGRREDNK